MENKVLYILCLGFFLGCNNNPKEDFYCRLEKVVYANQNIGFVGFNAIKIKKIEFKKLDNCSVKIFENQTLTEAISNDQDFEIYLSIKDTIVDLLQKDCFVIINNKFKYKISDVKTESIERFGMWGSIGFHCELKEYKLNDSLVKNIQYIKIFK